MTAVWKLWGNWSFGGHPFIWCSMSSMGGNLGLYGDLAYVNTAPLDAYHALSSSMAGVGFDPEGIDNNPAYWQVLMDTAWNPEPANISSFLETWGSRRCSDGASGGASDGTRDGTRGGAGISKVKQAWALLGETVYASYVCSRFDPLVSSCDSWGYYSRTVQLGASHLILCRRVTRAFVLMM